jgi:penicillin V acylase-like amidase (Ntn superfamily)
VKIPKIFPALLALANLLSHSTPVLACTGSALIAQDGRVAVGRTLDFGKPLDSVLAVWPAGSEFTGTTSAGSNGSSLIRVSTRAGQPILPHFAM